MIMKREIRFRGKTPQGEWLYGDLQQCNDGTVRIAVNNECWNDDGIQSSDYLKISEVNLNTIGQFTGLYDKYDKQIYEGDIVSHITGRMKVNGEYVDKTDVFAVEYRGAEFNISYLSLVSKNSVKVIGNIHDNPELLKS
jgi:uncharacterized phage protein (TIGR01671 family)